MLSGMNEPDEIQAEQLADALNRAKAAGRGDVADYLLLKAANDAMRAASVNWLLDSVRAIARQANQENARVVIEDETPHNFAYGNANIVGSLVRFRQGVRCLTVEAGWTRQPADGFMRGGALALARITHFGIGKHNEDLLLVKTGDTLDWFAAGQDGQRKSFDAKDLQRHFQIFLAAI